MWLIMRGAIPGELDVLHRSYYLPSMTGIATLLVEPKAPPSGEEERAAHRAFIGHQLRGLDAIDGTYPFDIATSVKTYRINRYLNAMIDPAHRALFLADPERSFAENDLAEEERVLIRARDWAGLIHYGAIFFGLEKLAAVLGIPNAAVYAGMRGESLEDFQRTRNAPGAIYSVADIDVDGKGKA